MLKQEEKGASEGLLAVFQAERDDAQKAAEVTAGTADGEQAKNAEGGMGPVLKHCRRTFRNRETVGFHF